MPAPTAGPTPWRGKKVSTEALEDLTRTVLREHGAADIKNLQRQAQGGRVNPVALEAAWSGHRTEILKWLSGMFEAFLLKDEWFLATVTLLDRAEVARPRFSHRKSFHIDTLTAAMATLKLSEVEAVFDCGIRDLVLQLARGVSGANIWDEVVKAERILYRLLDYRVCIPTESELAARIATELGLIARDTVAGWPGLKNMRLAMPGQEPSVPQPCFIMLLHYIMELCVVHKPDLAYQDSSPGVVALAALHLAVAHFGNTPPECANFLKEQQEFLLEAGEATKVTETMQRMADIWRNPPQQSEVVRKWRCRVLGSNSVLNTFNLLEPTPDPRNNLKDDRPASPEEVDSKVRRTGFTRLSIARLSGKSCTKYHRLHGIRPRSGKSGGLEQPLGKSEGKPSGSHRRACNSSLGRKAGTKRHLNDVCERLQKRASSI